MNNAATLLVLFLLRFVPVTLQSIEENEDAFNEVDIYGRIASPSMY